MANVAEGREMAQVGLGIGEALSNWGYAASRKKRKQLRKLCEIHPELCEKTKPIRLRSDIPKPYLPSHKNTDIYSHIVYAVKENSHIFSDAFHMDDDHLKRYIEELCEAGLITKLPKGKKNDTENYAVTIQAESWLNKRLKQKIKCIIEAIGPIKPDFSITNNFTSM